MGERSGKRPFVIQISIELSMFSERHPLQSAAGAVAVVPGGRQESGQGRCCPSGGRGCDSESKASGVMWFSISLAV